MVQYWLDLFTPETWEESRKNNFKLSGYRETRWNSVQKIRPGDILICYITRISRFSGYLRVISEPYKDLDKARKYWQGDSFPCVIDVEPVLIFDFLRSIPSKEIVPKLTIAKKWGGIVRGSPNRINREDGETIIKILKNSLKRKAEYPLAKKVIKYTSSRPRKFISQEYGEPIDFRGLRQAPINEQGVVYLFALVAQDLGFRVEAIGTAYPDCEAIRRIKQSDRWQRIHIEFEYKSSEFRKHGHKPEGCDLVVCWKHNWKECPIEVIELSEVIKSLV